MKERGQFVKLWKLVPAVVLAAGSVAAIPAVAWASTGVSPACAAATSAYHQDEADLNGILSQLKAAIGARQSLQDQVNADKGVIATYNDLESQESADKTAIENLTSAEGVLKESIPDRIPESLADVAIGLAVYAAKIGVADYSLNNVENQLNALDGQFQQDNADITGLTSQLSAADANVSALKNQSGEISLVAAAEAETAACQDSGSGSPAPTGSPAPSPSGTPTMDGGTQQYYNNGFNFVVQNTGPPSGGSVTVQAACTEVANASSGAGQAGSDPTDTGPTAADQAAWISGCVAAD
jgi:chromosome segregation ATPase